MTPENKNIPEWARRERERELGWIEENFDIFAIASKIAYEGTGRGAIVVDTTAQPIRFASSPF
jgi:hypothetical protein